MPTISKKDVLDLGGSLHDGVHPSRLDDREFAELRNFYQVGSKLTRRGGTKRITSTPYTENLTSLFTFKDSSGLWTVQVGAPTSIAKLDGTGITAIPISSGGSIPSSDRPWTTFQYKGVGYWLRELAGMKRVTDSVQSAGIPAPSTAPVLADAGAGGAVEAGTYIGVVTFLNTETDAESNPSPLSNSLTIAANHKIAWSSIPTSTTGQVNARRLYRTLPNQPGRYYLVAQINDNFTTTYTDNATIIEFDQFASQDNGLPPSDLVHGTMFKERCFAHNFEDVFFSEEGRPESFAEDSIIRVFPDDGHRIQPLHAFGERLIIGKTNKVHFITAGGALLFEPGILDEDHGCDARFSMKSAEGTLFWFGDGQVFRSDGTGVVSISTTKIKKFLKTITAAQKDRVVGAVFPPLSWFLLSVPVDSSTNNNRVLVYNYRDNVWAEFRFPEFAPGFIGDYFDTNYDPRLYATMYDGHLYELNEESTQGDFFTPSDFAVAIQASFKTKAFDFDIPAFYKGLRRAWLLATSVSETVILRVYRDGSTTPTKARTVSLDTTREWKRYNLNTKGKLAANIQLEVEYSGGPAIDISGLAMEVIQHFRSGRAA